MSAPRSREALRVEIKTIKESQPSAFDLSLSQTTKALGGFNAINQSSKNIETRMSLMGKNLIELDDAVMSVFEETKSLANHTKQLTIIFPKDHIDNKNIPYIKSELNAIEICLKKLKIMRDTQKNNFETLCKEIEEVNKELKHLLLKLEELKQVPPRDDFGGLYKKTCETSIGLVSETKKLLKAYADLYNLSADKYDVIRKTITKIEKEIYLPETKRLADLEKSNNNSNGHSNGNHTTAQLHQQMQQLSFQQPSIIKSAAPAVVAPVQEAVKLQQSGSTLSSNGKPISSTSFQPAQNQVQQSQQYLQQNYVKQLQ